MRACVCAEFLRVRVGRRNDTVMLVCVCACVCACE